MSAYPEASTTLGLQRSRSLDRREFGRLGRLGRWTAEHVRTVVVVWIAVAVPLGAYAPRAEKALSGRRRDRRAGPVGVAVDSEHARRSGRAGPAGASSVRGGTRSRGRRSGPAHQRDARSGWQAGRTKRDPASSMKEPS